MTGWEDNLWNEHKRKLFELFLNSRKNDKTREYSLSILEYLLNRYDSDMKRIMEHEEPDKITGGWSNDNAGWVRTKDLIKGVKIIPNESTFYQLLKNLYEANLIERKSEYNPRLVIEPGKQPVYYRVPGFYTIDLFDSFKTKEMLLRELEDTKYNQGKLALRIAVAEQLLTECHKDEKYDPKIAIMDKMTKLFPKEIISEMFPRGDKEPNAAMAFSVPPNPYQFVKKIE